MKKIISLFERDYEGNCQVIDKVTKGAEWVQSGEGLATQKYDGTCVMYCDGKMYKRYTLKGDRQKPADFEPVTEVDPNTGKQEGWVPVSKTLPNDKYHREINDDFYLSWPDGTYELCGPKINGNPEGFRTHILLRHGEMVIKDVPTSYAELKEWFKDKDIEGIVWHHPDGRMVKIKKKDFGLERQRDEESN